MPAPDLGFAGQFRQISIEIKKNPPRRFPADIRLSLPHSIFGLKFKTIYKPKLRTMNNPEVQTEQNQVISPAELLDHWQGHRRLTRRVIEAFPEKELFEFSIGGMRPFAKMVMELLGIAGPGMEEIVSRETAVFSEELDGGIGKAGLLQRWDEATTQIDKCWAKLSADQFHDQLKLFGQYEGTVISSVLYFIDNEIHHRAQGYVYLRALGVEPPAFYER